MRVISNDSGFGESGTSGMWGWVGGDLNSVETGSPEELVAELGAHYSQMIMEA